MKKLIICLIGAIILSNCEVSVKKTNAQSKSNESKIVIDHYTFEGMDYIVFTVDDPSGIGISVQNVTLHKLQCEIMTINIKKAKDGK